MRVLVRSALFLYLVAVLVSPPALAQSRSDAELKTLNDRFLALYKAGKYADALPIAENYAAGTKARYGENHPEYATALNNLAQLLDVTGRLAEAEPLFRRALAIDEKSLGSEHPDVATDLNNLAGLLKNMNRAGEAELLHRRALAIHEKSLGTKHPSVAIDLNNLAAVLQDTNRLAEAEPLYRRALAISEKSLGAEHPDVAIRLTNLAQLLQETDRLAEAEPLMRRALAIGEKNLGPEHPSVATRLNNLAELFRVTNRLSEAEPLYRRALAIDEKSFGPDHPRVARDLNNLGAMLRGAHRLSEAEPLYRRSLAIDEKRLGPEHPNVAIRLNNLAVVLEEGFGNYEESERLKRRALAIHEKSLGLDHPYVAIDLNNLAILFESQGQWANALAFLKRAKPIMTGAGGTLRKATLAQNAGSLKAYARALYHADAKNGNNLSEGFELAQWALQNSAADALSSMSVRFAKGDATLAKPVREQQDLLAARETAYRSLDIAAGKADAKAAEEAHAAIAEIEAKLAQSQALLRKDFPEYADLASPKPLAMADAQALLSETQALVLFIDLRQLGKLPEETIVFALTNKEARWVSVPLGTPALQKRVTALRCGLDASQWREGENSRELCKQLLNVEVSEFAAPPFSTALAYALYRDLFSGIEDLIKDKALLVVPSGPLTQFPLEVLVTEKPGEELPQFEAYQRAAWLGARQAITVLPSAGSLKALSAAKASGAPLPFIGFGNALLTGAYGTDTSAFAKQDCGKAAPPKRTLIASLAVKISSLFSRGGVVSVEDLRHQPPLPETADELCAVGRGLGVPENGLDKTIFLGERATVTQVKALSQKGELAKARVVHFATHGLLAGETALFAKNKAEPALVLTPPSAGKASDEDNGLLTASEVAQLNLNADWVIMSACNTAAGQGENAEALSGLARAFFYAGARSLLVSHWPVNSEAAVAITTGAVTIMQNDPNLGRAEALHRSIGVLIAKGGDYAHPSVWAPFVLVGSGGL